MYHQIFWGCVLSLAMSLNDGDHPDYSLYTEKSTDGSAALAAEPQVLHHSNGDRRPLILPVQDGREMEESFSQADAQVVLAALERAVGILRGQVQAEETERTWYGCLEIRINGKGRHCCIL